MYFDSDDNFQRLLTELHSWKGTKFVEHGSVKGKGVDCCRFAERVLVAVGAIAPVIFPPYVISGGGEQMLSRLFDTMDTVKEMDCLWKYGPLERHPIHPTICRGDLLICSSGKALHHLVLVAAFPVVWHALMAVEQGSFYDPIIKGHMVGQYRVR